MDRPDLGAAARLVARHRLPGLRDGREVRFERGLRSHDGGVRTRGAEHRLRLLVGGLPIARSDALLGERGTQLNSLGLRALDHEEFRRQFPVRVRADRGERRALSLSVGRPSTGDEVVTLLERTRKERGGPPLLFFVDGGSNYSALEVVSWCEINMVILLRSEPRTAQHNSREERGRRELKEDAELGKKSVLEPLPCKRWTVLGGRLEIVDGGEGGEEDANPSLRLPSWCRRTQRAMAALNELRTRPSRGGMTASALDAALPPG